MQIFMAHAKEDEGWAQELKKHLESSIPGLRVFLSPYDLRPGDPMWAKTLQALERSSAVIALISRHYFHSNAREEVGYAFRVALERNLRIIPILIDPEVANPPQLPAMIKHLKALDFTQALPRAWNELRTMLQKMKLSEEVSLGLILTAVLFFLIWWKGNK